MNHVSLQTRFACLFAYVLVFFAVKGCLIQCVHAADSTTYQVVAPGEVRLTVPCAGNCRQLEWWKQPSFGAWAVFAQTRDTLEIADTLANRTAARYRVRAYVSGWVCDEAGCRDTGEPVYGEFGESSVWVIADQGGGPGNCGKVVIVE